MLHVRPARRRSLDRLKEPDGSLGGVRIYSDDEYKVNSLLDLDLYLRDGSCVQCTARVAWTHKLPKGGVARFEVGLAFVDLPPEAQALLNQALHTDGDDDPDGPGGSGGGPRRPANQASLGVRGYRAGWKAG